MADKKDTPAQRRKKLKGSLERVAKKLEKSTSLKPGEIVFRLSGAAGGDFNLACGEGQVRMAESSAMGAGRQPLVEVMGDVDTIRAILDGETDARAQFLEGGLRVRGDLRYLSDLALELGVLKVPL